MPDRTFTTYEIAKFCDVYPSSVIHWINKGQLKAYLTPGGHHRVIRADLMDFLKQFNIPIPAELREGPHRVLVVDDDIEVTRLMERAFGRYPNLFKIEVCHDGMDALIRIGQDPPDLIILDIVLPKMDGLQVCKILRSKAETRKIKIIAITGKRISDESRRFLSKNADASLGKPLDVADLTALAIRLIKAQESTR